MKLDICLPDGNEQELISRAKELKYDAVVFLYRFKSRGEILKKREELRDVKNLDKLYLDSDLVGAIAQTEELVRVCAENPRIDFVFEITTGSGREHTHYRYSNMTSVITGLMKKNKCSYAISFSQILNAEGSVRAKILGRIMQNVRLLRRKIPILSASF